MQNYTTHKTRTYTKLTRYDRRNILLSRFCYGVERTLERFNIDEHTLRIVERSDMGLIDYPLTLEEKCRAVKYVEQETSGTAAAKLHAPLSIINAMWPHL